MIVDDANKTNTLWLFQKIKTNFTRSKFQVCFYQHAEYLPLKSEQATKTTDKPSEIIWRTILFANFSGRLNCWVWAFGGLDSPTCNQDRTNQIWTQICIPTVFFLPQDADVSMTGISSVKVKRKCPRKQRAWTSEQRSLKTKTKNAKNTNRFSWIFTRISLQVQ